MDIVASSWRSIVDDTAFEEMVANWEAKLAADTAPEDEIRISKRLFGQLLTTRKTLETLDIPADNDPLKRAVSDVPGPAVVLSPDGRVATVNTTGERGFATRQGAFLDPSIIAPESLEDYQALRRAATGQGNGAQAILQIVAPDQDMRAPFLAEGYLIRLPGQTGAHVVLRSLEIDWTPRASDRLQQAFGLTQAEAEVAEQYFLLRSIDRIAELRGVSRLTVRTQVKTIMAKTGSPSNVDLMRLLGMIANRELLGSHGESPVWHDPLEREELIELPDGRVIAWTWMGDGNGIPVVMSRGLPMTYLLPGDGEARLRDAGIKLLVLSRPGYGNSSMDPELSVMEDNLIALRAFLDRVVPQPCLGIGLASGILPLLAEQETNPARFHSLLAVGFTAAFDPSGMARLPMIQRTMLRLADAAPWVVEFMAKTGHRQMRAHGLDWYLERAFRHTPLNQQTARDPDRAALIRNACEHALKQGHAVFVRELQLVRTRMDTALHAVAVPLHYLAPCRDAAIDLDRIRQWEARNPMITVEPLRDAAELVFYQQTDLIIDRIIAAARKG